jgi:hypothetical protein
MPYVTSIGVPLLTGGLEGLGAKTTGQFVSNLANPFNIVPGYKSAERAIGQQLGNVRTSIAPELRQGLRTNGPSFNSSELFDLNNVRKPSGSIGNQGATSEGANKILQSLGIDVKGATPNEVTLKEMVEHLKNNPNDASTYKKFLEKEPISVSELPGGEYHINDGHHRATLSYYSGNENIPTIIKNKGEYIKQKDGGVIKDDRGQWDHPGEITEIGSNQITMQGVPYPVLGISDTGDTQMMYPEEEYEFDGDKVTEYPMAQEGIEAFKKQPFKLKKEQNIAVKDKTSVKQNKQNKIVIEPLTKKQIVNNSINNQARFMKDWMNSPMYNEMVDNSTTGYFDKHYLNSGRNFNLDNTKVQMHPQPEDLPNIGATSNRKTGLIKLFPLGAKGDALEGMLAHEISHSSDRPTYWDDNWFQQHGIQPVNKYNNEYRKKEVRLIPEKDINLMKSFYSNNKAYKNLFNKSALKNKELNENREWFNYVSEPTETRARLNDIRYNAKKYGVYDPFTQKVTSEILNEIKELTKKAKGFDPFNQLQGIYSDEEILNLLNTVSQNEQPNKNSNIAIAKNGLRQEQKGLQNLDNLTNFTNYNKPQSGGWLNKYN